MTPTEFSNATTCVRAASTEPDHAGAVPWRACRAAPGQGAAPPRSGGTPPRKGPRAAGWADFPLLYLACF
jgi:hypothetical protein